MKKTGSQHEQAIGLAFMILVLLSFTDAYGQVTKLWETGSVFCAPESVVFDPLNKCLYVSNFNDKGGFRNADDTLPDECISKIDLNGNIQEFRWIDSLFGPTGLAINNNGLFIVERNGLSIASVDKGTVERKVIIENAGFLNDVAVDRDGTAYVSDSRNSCIYRIQNGISKIWYSDTLINSSNGLFIDDDNLLIGNASNTNLISVSLADKTVQIIAENVSDNIDGVRKFKNSYLLSWRSELYMVDREKNKTILFRSESESDYLADFEFIEADHLIIIPTLLTNKVIALKID